MTHTLTVHYRGQQHTFEVVAGQNLRHALLQQGLSPYTALTGRVNCGGRGLCATCGVIVHGEPPAPTHWHDRLAARYRYPRLSCQITVNANLHITIPPKVVWGSRLPRQ